MGTRPPIIRKKRPAKRSDEGGNRLTFLLLGSLAAVIVLAGAVQFFRLVIPRIASGLEGGSRIDLSYLPAKADVLVVLRAGRLWNSPASQAHRAHPESPRQLAALWRVSGLHPRDVDRVTFAAVGSGSRSAEPELGRFVIVFRALDPVPDLKPVEGLVQIQAAVLDGVEYSRLIREIPDSRPLAAYRPQPNILVLGDEQLVREAIQRGGDSKRRRELGFLDPKRDLILVFMPTFGLGVGSQAAEKWPVLDAEAAAAIRKETRLFALELTVQEGIAAKCTFECHDETSASVLEQHLQTAVGELQEDLSVSRNDAAAGWKRLYHLADRTAQSVAVTRSGSTLALEGAIPATLTSVLGNRTQGRVHTLVFTPFDRAFAEFPVPDFPNAPQPHPEPRETRADE